MYGDLWRGRMARTYGEDVWRGRMAIYGEDVWRGRMAMMWKFEDFLEKSD
jgi:hypothetical protein